VIIAVYMLEYRFSGVTVGHGAAPTVTTLAAMGGLSRSLLSAGGWYRIFTAPLLHSNVAHLLANGIALALAGYTLERLVGRAWMFCIFAIGALGGAAGSLLFLAPSTVSVGASGAIMAMLVALFSLSFRLPPGAPKARIQVQSARIAIPALIPVGHATGAIAVDYGAHFGGALTGLLLGFLLLRSWQRTSPLPGFKTAAVVVSAVMTLAFAGSVYTAARQFPVFAAASVLIPIQEIPHGANEIAARTETLLAKYPRDPRSHVFEATAMLKAGNNKGAEQELRTALSLADAVSFALAPSFANLTRAILAATLVDEGRADEAKVMARQPCRATGVNALEPQLLAQIKKMGLCGPGEGPSLH
jgi:rhomboid protease GluP